MQPFFLVIRTVFVRQLLTKLRRVRLAAYAVIVSLSRRRRERRLTLRWSVSVSTAIRRRWPRAARRAGKATLNAERKRKIQHSRLLLFIALLPQLNIQNSTFKIALHRSSSLLCFRNSTFKIHHSKLLSIAPLHCFASATQHSRLNIQNFSLHCSTLGGVISFCAWYLPFLSA